VCPFVPQFLEVLIFARSHKAPPAFATCLLAAQSQFQLVPTVCSDASITMGLADLVASASNCTACCGRTWLYCVLWAHPAALRVATQMFGVVVPKTDVQGAVSVSARSYLSCLFKLATAHACINNVCRYLEKCLTVISAADAAKEEGEEEEMCIICYASVPLFTAPLWIQSALCSLNKTWRCPTPHPPHAPHKPTQESTLR
jgi:hypothetical protein